MNTATLFHQLRRGLRASGAVTRLGAFRLLRISRLAMQTVEDVVREEVQAGRVGPVADRLKAQARKVLTEKLARRLVAALLLRLGIESALASTVVGLLLPFVLEYAIRRLGQTQAWARFSTRDDVVSLKEKIKARLPGARKPAGAAPTGA